MLGVVGSPATPCLWLAELHSGPAASLSVGAVGLAAESRCLPALPSPHVCRRAWAASWCRRSLDSTFFIFTPLLSPLQAGMGGIVVSPLL